MSGANFISGILNVDTAALSATNDGVVRLAGPDAASSISAINLRNQGSASSSLQLDGTNGGVNVSAPLLLNGRTSFTVAIQNLSGTNTLNGNLSITNGGGNYWIQSDAGLLTLGGNISAIAAGTHALTIKGAGDTTVNGSVANGTGAAMSLTKTDGGTLTLGGTNTFTGPFTVNNGRIIINGVVNNLNVAAGTLGGSGQINGAVNIPAGATLAPGPALTSTNHVGTLTISNNLTLQPGSTTVIKIDKTYSTNDQLTVSGLLTYGGTLAVTSLNAPLTGGDVFTIVNAPNFSAVTVSPGTGLNWKFNPTNGVLTIFSTVPPNLGSLITNNALQLSWPADHLGWTLQVQTNDLAAGLGTNWISLPDSATNTVFTAPLDPANGSVFYRLIYQ